MVLLALIFKIIAEVIGTNKALKLTGKSKGEGSQEEIPGNRLGTD